MSSWVERVKCVPCRDFTDWVVVDGSWTCHYCGSVMSPAAIKDMQERTDAEEKQ